MRLPGHPQDVAVIGAGMGGLTAAALLAKAGLRVCVIESGTQPGGCMAGFERGGFHFETAVHWLNQCGPNGLVRRVLDYVEAGAPETRDNTLIRRFLGDTFDCLLSTDPGTLRDALAEMHPQERPAVERFFRTAQVVGRSFTELEKFCRIPQTMPPLQRLRFGLAAVRSALPLLRYGGQSARRGLTKTFPSRALQRVFCSEDRLLSCLTPVGWAYQGDFQLPPVGGSRELPRWLCGRVEALGGAVHYGTSAEVILVESGHAAGVRVRQGTETLEVKAPHVIAACDVRGVYERMLPPGSVDASRLSAIRQAQVYDSCVTISLGLDCPAQDLGFGDGEEMVMITRDSVGRSEHSSGDPRTSSITVVPISQRDPTLAPPGKSALTIYAPVSIGYGDTWKSRRDDKGQLIRGPEYRAFKQRHADTLISRVADRMAPDLRKHIEVLDIATPLTYLRHTGNHNGAIMGFRPTSANIRRRVARSVTPVKNLYIGSQWAGYGGGIPGAVKAGVNGALLVLRREKPEAFRELCEVVDGSRRM